MIDTLKTTCAGMGGCWIGFMDLAPQIVSLLVGLATLVYLIIKINRELGK